MRKVNLTASLAGILLMTFLEKLQAVTVVLAISMKTASGTCCSWQSERSAGRMSPS